MCVGSFPEVSCTITLKCPLGPVLLRCPVLTSAACREYVSPCCLEKMLTFPPKS